MADADWDSVTRIGSKVRAGGGTAVDRERVVKGKSAINAASRSGAIIGAEKKYASSNSKASVEGQHLTKVDRSDEIVKPKTVGREVGQAITKRRNEITPKMTQKDLATRTNMKDTEIQQFENGSAPPDQTKLGRIERVLGIKLRGSDIGSPLTFGKKK
ncbi:Multiprotein-bridging factor 1 [Exophiala mesophila]|uniref:Multiprotein-bridging factor 1 n=1 Tax=Exophiala mesophila TaxID=212818 RepID=A0A438NIK2_EXOME|nr:Multiprotein-bridging factor 1 [Exophiala mesophila]